MQKITNTEFEESCQVLFNMLTDICNVAGLDFDIKYKEVLPGVHALKIYIDGKLISILHGSIMIESNAGCHKFVKWMQIEQARHVAQLAEGLSADDKDVRNKAKAKKVFLTLTKVT